MKAQELREKTPDQLRDQLASLKKSLLICVFSRQPVNLKILLVRAVKRDTARVLTILNQQADSGNRS